MAECAGGMCIGCSDNVKVPWDPLSRRDLMLPRPVYFKCVGIIWRTAIMVCCATIKNDYRRLTEAQKEAHLDGA